MSLIDVRKNFIIHGCGRYDLVKDAEDDNWSDNGADYFIQQGQRWLDRHTTLYHSFAKYFKILSAGEWYVLVPDARSIQSVWVNNTEGAKWKLEQLDMNELRQEFSGNPGDSENGDPLYYSLGVLRSVPQAPGLTTVDQFGATVYTVADNHYNFEGITFLPPAKVGTSIEVHGLFYQPTLRSDGDKNMWTENNSFVLVLAACRALEVMNRNQAGVKDYENAIDSELLGLEFDLVDQRAFNITQMTG